MPARVLVPKRELQPMRPWQVQEAKARFSELLEACLKKGPQVVTQHGVEAVVLVPIDEWRRLQRHSQPTLKQLLLGEGSRFEALVPPRRRLQSLR